MMYSTRYLIMIIKDCYYTSHHYFRYILSTYKKATPYRLCKCTQIFAQQWNAAWSISQEHIPIVNQHVLVVIYIWASSRFPTKTTYLTSGLSPFSATPFFFLNWTQNLLVDVTGDSRNKMVPLVGSSPLGRCTTLPGHLQACHRDLRVLLPEAGLPWPGHRGSLAESRGWDVFIGVHHCHQVRCFCFLALDLLSKTTQRGPQWGSHGSRFSAFTQDAVLFLKGHSQGVLVPFQM